MSEPEGRAAERPLAGTQVVVTRAETQAADLAARLERLGAEVVVLPAIEIGEPADGGTALRAAAKALVAGAYDWLVVTSANGAHRLIGAGSYERPKVGGARVAAIGPATAAVLRQAGVTVDLVPERFVAEALVDAFPDGPGRVLVARAADARDVLPAGLRAKGWTVEVVEAYRTRAVAAEPGDVEAAATADVITFTSPSTVEGVLAVLPGDRVPPVVACIGPITAAAARERGLGVAIEASVHTIDGLVAAIVDWARL